MSLNRDLSKKINIKNLKKTLKEEIENQFEILYQEEEERFEKIGYVRPRVRLEKLNADLYMTNKQFSNILGLEQIIKTIPELTDDDIHKFITYYKRTFKFLNYLLDFMPNAISLLRCKGADSVVTNYTDMKRSYNINY